MFRKTLIALTFSLAAGSTMADSITRDLEPCMNGEVSASGAYPTQEMETQILAYAEWRANSDEPFYLCNHLFDMNKKHYAQSSPLN